MSEHPCYTAIAVGAVVVQLIAGVQYQGRGEVAAGRVLRDTCLICEQSFDQGDEYAMVPVGPFNDVEAAKAAQGEPFVAWHKPTHWACLVVRLATVAGFMRQRAEA